MRTLIIKSLYTLLLLPLAIIRIIFKATKNPLYLSRLYERFALFPKINNSIDIWFHTVSVGEFIAAQSLIDQVIANNHKIKLLLTCTTPTGSKLIQSYIQKKKIKYNIDISHYYYPYDVRVICSKFLNNVKPNLAVFFETEIWPKMFTEVKKRSIKLMIVNARLSEKSFQGYNKIQEFIAEALNKVDFIAAQAEADKNRFINLGYDSDKIKVFGNIKYNINLPTDLTEESGYYKKSLGQNRLILIAASTHPGEDEIILNIYLRIKQKFPGLLLILAPRHPERFEKVYNLCERFNLETLKYSEFDDQINYTTKNVLVLNTIGKLLYFYNIADLAFIGGSLVKVGGHNPLEPAILAVPTIMGENYYNFNEIITDLFKHNGISIVKNEDELQFEIEKLLANPDLREQIGQSAKKSFESHHGILERYMKLLN